MAGTSQVWVPVNAQMKGFVADVVKQASGAASKGSKAMSDEFGQGGRAAGKAMADGLASQASQVEKISTKLGQARKAEATAAADVLSAEAKLEGLRKSGSATASQLARAEQVLETAKAKQADAGARMARAEHDLTSVRDGGRATAVSLARAEDQLATAKTNAGTALGKARTAEIQVDEARAKSKERADQVAAAEVKLIDVRDRYGANTKETAKAERELEAAKKQAQTAEERVADAVGRSAKARAEMASANDQMQAKTMRLQATLDDLARSERDAGDAATEMGNEVERSESGLSGLAETAKGAAFQLGALLGAGSLISSGWEVSGAISEVNNQLGLTGDAAELVGDEIGGVLRGGVAGSVEEAAGAIGSLNSQFHYLGFEGEQTAEQLSDNFLAFTKTFGVDMEEATQTAGQLVKNGLATDVEDAADLMTVAMQRVPAAMRGEMPEIINEYGTHFRALGFSGEEAFGMLVSQAENGKWALDKTGDALKEFSIRGSDMSKASSEAFESVGLNAQDMAQKIATGGAEGRDALDQTAQAILGIEDPAQRANTAIALFGTPLEDLSVDQIPTFLEGLSGAGSVMGDVSGASEQLGDTFENSLEGRMNVLKGTVQDLAGKGFMALWDAVGPITQWAKDNGTWLGPLVTGLGAMAGVIGGVALATKAWAAALGVYRAAVAIATGQTALFNTALLMNPLVWVAAAIIGVIAGLALFFTKTETGRRVWASFMDSLRSAWQWLKDTLAPVFSWIGEKAVAGWNAVKAGWDVLWQAMQNAWTNYIRPIFDGLMNAAKIVAGVVLTVLITPLYLAWKALSAGFMWGWENFIKPAWDAIQVGAQFLWNSVLMPVFGWIKQGWELLILGIQWYWENVLKPAWDALQLAAQWMWSNVLMPVFEAIKQAWQMLMDAMKWAWENILKPTWDIIATTLNWLWDSVFSPVLGFIQDRWQAMGEGIRWVKDNVIQPVFDGIGSALDTLKGWFASTVEAIGHTWDRIKEKTAAPIRWVVDSVYNNGIKKVWDNIAKFIGLEELPAAEMNFATGGVLPGYTPGKDVHHFTSPTGGRLNLSGGEAIMRPEWTRAVGGPKAVEQMNSAARTGKLSTPAAAQAKDNAKIAKAHNHRLGGVMAFAGGGVVEAMTAIVQQKYPGMQMTSGYRNSADNHGRGLAGDFSDGFSNTPAMIALANDIADTYPGSMELIHEYPGFDRQIKNGQFVGGGGGSWGFYAGAGDHANHVHWAMDTPPTMPFGGGVFAGGSSGGGGGFNPVGGIVRKMWDEAINPIKDAIPEFPGMVGGIPKAAFETITGKVWSFIQSKIPAGGGSSGNGPGAQGGNVEQWRGLVEKLLQVKGQPLALTDSVLRRMNQESGGDPGAINNWDSNAAAGTPSKGLMQVIDPTFQSNKDPGFDDIWDPESNIRASMNYAMRQYGSLSAAYDRAGGYDSGGYLQPGVTRVQNDSGKPEPVFSHDQWQVLKGNISSSAEAQDWKGAIDGLIEAAEMFANGVEKFDDSAAVDTAADAKAAGTTDAGTDAVSAGTSTATTATGDGTSTAGDVTGGVSGDVTGASTASGASTTEPDVQGTMRTAGEGMVKGQFEDALGVFGAPTELPPLLNAGKELLAGLAPAGIAAGKAALAGSGVALSAGMNAAVPGSGFLAGPLVGAGSAMLDMLAPLATGQDPAPAADTGAAVVVPADATAGAGEAGASAPTAAPGETTTTASDGTTYQIVVNSMGQAYEAVKHMQARELAGFGAHR